MRCAMCGVTALKLRASWKDSEISEDERHDLETDIQKLTDDHVKQIDDALSNKETEITQV